MNSIRFSNIFTPVVLLAILGFWVMGIFTIHYRTEEKVALMKAVDAQNQAFFSQQMPIPKSPEERE